MAQENKISIVLDDAEVQAAKEAVQSVGEKFKQHLISLTPQQRQMYGRVKYEKIIFIDKAWQYMQTATELVPAWVDKEEFGRDYAAHKQLADLLVQVERLRDKISDTLLLLGYDLDSAALAFYQNTKMAAKMNAPGARTLYEDMKQQFPGGKPRNSGKDIEKL